MTQLSLSAYADQMIDDEDDLLKTARAEAERAGLPAIQVPRELARLLRFLIVSSNARTVLEIGTLFGYSAIVMARELPADGTLITLEVNPQHAAYAEANLRRANLTDRTSVIVGPAIDTLATMVNREFDLVFLDADKLQYPEYLSHMLRLTHSGSVIVADNVWRDGVVTRSDVSDPNARGVAEFNRLIASQSQLLTALVPTRDGADAVSVSVVR